MKHFFTITILIILLFFSIELKSNNGQLVLKSHSDNAKIKPLIAQTKPKIKKTISFNKYKKIIQKYAKKYNLSVDLITSIIKKESNGISDAESGKNALGLMQLIPTQGGLDAIKYVYKDTTIINDFKKHPKKYLFDPDMNIHLGSAYLNILKKTYNGIDSVKSLNYVIISAYNTGPGNLNKVFTGKTNTANAINIINTLSQKGVYNTLIKNAHPETSDYLCKITSFIN